MARLGKRDVETLMGVYDDDPQAALSTALAHVLNLPGASWSELIAAARFDPHRHHALLEGDRAAMDELAAELNELRTLPGR